MKIHSTNYKNTFIEIAEDCPVDRGEVPRIKGDKKSVANLQFEMVYDNPYKYTSDDVFYTVYATRKEIGRNKWDEGRRVFFSKGQPCFRASPLSKRYGWGVHSDAEGKVALFGAGTQAYRDLVADESIVKVKAMKSKR